MKRENSYFQSTKYLTLNARGVKFELPFDIFNQLPNSRLGKLKQLIESKNSRDENEFMNLCDSFNLATNEFYFNKDSQIINLILDFYSINTKSDTKKIHINVGNFCVNSILDELKYWQIENYEDYLYPCCLRRIENEKELLKEDQERDASILKTIEHKEDFGKYCLPKYREILWNIIEKPQSSIVAKIYMIFSYAMILLSTLDLILRTLPELKKDTNSFFIIEIICISWFTFEIIIRFIICPNKLKFILSPLTICDLLSIIPYYFYLGFQTVDQVQRLKNISRIFRSISLIKIFKYSNSLKILFSTLKNSYKEVFIYLTYLTMCILVFSSILYFCEYSMSNTKFVSIPATFWWAVITMTTVGYGDMYPETVGGKIFGAICAISGVIVLAMPIGVLSNNFSRYYEIDNRRKQLMKKSQKEKNDVSNNINI